MGIASTILAALQSATAEDKKEIERLGNLIKQISKSRCDECGATINLHGCLTCGAPQCCPQCCTIDSLRTHLEAAEKAIRSVADESIKNDVLCDDGFTFSFQRNSKIHKMLTDVLTKKEGAL